MFGNETFSSLGRVNESNVEIAGLLVFDFAARIKKTRWIPDLVAMDRDQEDDVLTRLRSAYNGLSPQLRRGARYLLDQPDDAALLSMRRVAATAEVQPATLVRLAKRLGCSGYDELRDAFRDRLRGAGSAYGDRARRIQSRTSGQRRGRGLAALAAEMVHADLISIRPACASRSARCAASTETSGIFPAR